LQQCLFNANPDPNHTANPTNPNPNPNPTNPTNHSALLLLYVFGNAPWVVRKK